MRNIDIKGLKVKGAKKFLKTLAFALALSNVVSTTPVNASMFSSTDNNTAIEIEHDHTDCDFCVEEHEFECTHEVHEIEEFLAGNTTEVKVETIEKSNDSKVSKIDITNYKGTSIVEALASNGYESSFEFRKSLAGELGIENYQGTAEQNIKLISELKKVTIDAKQQEKKEKEEKTNTAKVEYVRIQTIAAYLASLENLTFKSDKDAYDWAIKANLLKGNYNYSLNRQDLSNALMNYAAFKGVNINAVDFKLDKVVNSFTDKKVKMNNINNMARAYYYGYIDVDKDNNANPYVKITIADVNYGFNNLLKDIQIATMNNSKDEKGLLIVKPNINKYSRDKNDTTLINIIRGIEAPQAPVVPSTPVAPEAPSTPSEPTNPDVKPTPSPTPIHKHSYGKWYGISDTQEERECKGCHKKEHQGHDYGAWTDLNETTEQCKCKRCGWTKTRTKEDTHTHSYSGPWLNDANDDENCYRICTHAGCTHKEYKNHSYGNESSQCTSNNDGTHNKVTTKTCSDCGHVHELSNSSESCHYGATTYSPSGSDKHKVIQVCEDCNYENSYIDDCDFGAYSYDSGKNKDIANCSHCSNYKELAHTHKNYSDWEQKDEYECIRECLDCHDTQSKSHNFADSADGTEEVCQDCRYSKPKTQHSHHTSTRQENITNDKNSFCYEEVVYCTDPTCGKELSRTPVAHKWKIISQTAFVIEYGCENCTAKYEEDLPYEEPPLMLMSVPDAEDILVPDIEDIVPNDPEDQEQLPNDPEDQEQHPENENNQPANDPIDEIINQVINEVIEENNQLEPEIKQSEAPIESQSEEGPSKTLEL